MTCSYSIKKFMVSDPSNRICNWTVLNQCDLIAISISDMSIDTVVASIQMSTTEPLCERWIAVVQHLIVHFIP